MGLDSNKTTDHNASSLEPNEPTFAFLSGLGRHLVHELNNPISAISSAVYLIQDILNSQEGSVQKGDIQPFLESIQEECDSLKSVVEEFSKYVSTKSVILLPIDLVEFLRARANDLAREGFPVSVEASESKLVIDADAGALTLVLRALAETARNEKATNITFRLDNLDVAQIAVSDNRPQKATESDLASMFSPIPQRDGAVQRGSGLGLRLPLAKRIVELHGGTLDLSNSADNETEIKILLPVKAPSA